MGSSVGNPVVELLRAAVRAGHTVLPHDVVLRTCSAADAAAAVASVEVVDVEWRGAPAWALSEVAESEEMLADGLLGLAQDNRLAIVVGADSAARQAALARSLGSGTPSVVLDDAHTAGLDEVLAAVEDLPEDAALVLSLDNALPLGAVAGAVALDLAAAGVCPVLVADRARDTSALTAARRDVAAGTWRPAVASDRSFVTVPVGSPDEALVRVTQLVATSIPRTFAHSGSSIGVLLAPGSLALDVVRRALTDAGAPHVEVVPLNGPTGRSWPAAVVVLAGPGVPGLTRSLVYAGLVAGEQHVSVVHGFADESALGEIVASSTDRVRRTRLTDLLTT